MTTAILNLRVEVLTFPPLLGFLLELNSDVFDLIGSGVRTWKEGELMLNRLSLWMS